MNNAILVGMKTALKLFIGIWFCCCLPEEIFGQETSPIQVFTPKQTRTGNQNWMIDQHEDGTVFFANNQGLASYNGAQWRLHPAEDNSIVRSVKSVNQRIYSSSYMDFGYWEKNDADELHYTSLSEELNIDLLEDEQFWNIIPFEEKILFQSLNRILLVAPDEQKFTSFSFENTLVKSFAIETEIYFQVLNQGLYKITNDKAVLVSKHPLFQQNNLVNIIKLQNDLLIITQEKGFYQFSFERGIKPWKKTNELLKDRFVIYAAVQLQNEQFALGTVGKGLLILSKNGTLIDILNQEKGLSNNTVLSLYEDQKNNLWLGLDNGINLVNSASAFKEYVDVNGQIGSVYTSAIKGDLLYLGTNQGLFVKNRQKEKGFQLIDNTQGQVWNLTKIGDALFCGHDRGTFQIEGIKARLISDKRGAWRFKQHPSNSNLIFTGNYTGINTIEKINGVWRDRTKLEGFDISSRFFEFLDHNTIVVNHEYKGVFLIELDENYEKATQIKIDDASCKSCNSSLVKFNNQLYYKAKSQLFSFNNEKQTFEPSDFFSRISDEKDFVEGKLIDDGDGQLWVLAKNSLYTLIGTKNNLNIKNFSLNEGDRKNVSGFENINRIGEFTYLIGSSRGYLTVNLKNTKKDVSSVKITAIRADNKNSIEPLSLSGESTLANNYNNLNYQFTNFDYNRYGKTFYQYQLVGEDTKWSEWNENTSVNYSNLSPGTYQFKVRSRNENIISSAVNAPAINIAAPWYLNRIAISVYAVILLLLLFAYNTYYRRKLKRQRVALKKENDRRLEIQELETQKEFIRLRNEQLKKDIEGKSRELAVATMSTLKQNEFLNTIKKELENVKEKKTVNKIVKSINTKLKNNDDWEYFKKAFDNTDQGLFRKLKAEHPSLTKNDLKLCAYLRLNLSSKEIAPLLNISVHSVEIKRYRLRKKMNLERSQGIVEYIMTF